MHAKFADLLCGRPVAVDGGIVALTREILRLGRGQTLRLAWRDGRCELALAEESAQPLDAPIRLSILRAVLARLAVLCQERQPGSATPYGGQGEVILAELPGVVFHVAFANRPDEIRLDLSSVPAVPWASVPAVTAVEPAVG